MTTVKGKEIADLLDAAIRKPTPEQLIAEIEDISRTMPPIETLHHMTPEKLSWIGRFSAFVETWELSKTLALNMAVHDFYTDLGVTVKVHERRFKYSYTSEQ